MVRIIYSSLHLLSMISLFSLVYGAAASVAKPGCPEKCGNVTVPYPFGIGKGCFLSKFFELRCNTSSYTVTDGFHSEVYEIGSQGYIRRQGFSFPLLYNGSSSVSLNQLSIIFEDGVALSFSQAKNKFVSIGCDIYAYMTHLDTNDVIAGCPSLCSNSRVSRTDSLASSCSGNGCCQTTIAENFIDISFTVLTMNTAERSWASANCSIAMIVEKDFNDFDRFNIHRCDDFTAVPVVYDWGIGNISCHEAVKRRDYTCGQNSKCINSTRGIGYLCTCLPGYQGNPYLPNGCKDINECEIPAKNDCPKKAICVNTPGSHFCTCQPGYYRKDSGTSAFACVPMPNRWKRSMVIFISSGIGIATSFLILVLACIWMHQTLKTVTEKEARKKLFKRLLQQQLSSSNESIFETKLFFRKELEKATDNFNESRILGKGGLGTVYKGMLSDGTIVAVKKSNKIDRDQLSQFINEVLILSQINHRHIIKLLGCCLATEVPLLVYEFVSNGTLSHHLHDDPSAGMIAWEHRLRIATEVAGALAYLHSHASTAIFHRDIKSSNILLDENYRAVVSDFGLSRSVPIDKTHLTTIVGGTFGYLDPEYFRSGQLNDKSDVYAFGVVLAELLTGQKAISSAKSDVGLVMRLRSTMKENRLFEIVNKIVVDEGLEEEILAVGKLAKRCLKLNARKRPCMKEVAAELEQLRRIRQGSILNR